MFRVNANSNVLIKLQHVSQSWWRSESWSPARRWTESERRRGRRQWHFATSGSVSLQSVVFPDVNRHCWHLCDLAERPLPARRWTPASPSHERMQAFDNYCCLTGLVFLCKPSSVTTPWFCVSVPCSRNELLLNWQWQQPHFHSSTTSRWCCLLTLQLRRCVSDQQDVEWFC